ncbi:MtN3-like protein [Phytophthora cinnamomi]|uniref:MtN3-like protein n=1 Tax=Phytophthora cinnamomi TaxID=4785 RepID=UPI003559B011|nr:MtN3-like protein [Phytophthora cinnamomi]
MASDALLTTLRVLTFITAIAVGLSPFPEIDHVYKHRAVGDVSIFPVVTLFGNSYLWMIYSYLIGNFFPLFSVTAFAALTSVAFSSVYWWYSSGQQTTRRFYKLWGGTAVLLAVVTIYAVIAISGATHQSKHQVVIMLGYMCVVMNLLLKFAPLETIKRIIRTKNASSMPVTMSVVAFVNGVLWVWTSTILDDMFVLTPNAAGAALGGIQVVVYVMYRPGKALMITMADNVNFQPTINERLTHIDDTVASMGKTRTGGAALIELRSPV